MELEIAHRRMQNVRLLGAAFARPEAAVQWFGAVQAQDYFGAKWALGQRTRTCTDSAVEQAFQSGALIRTHVLRPTWHFVTPTDVRWMLELTTPRVHAANAHYYRKVGLDGRTFLRSETAIAKALEGGHHLTRAELAGALARAGIRGEGIRLGYLMMHAELEAVICSGPRRGNQFTYALFDERVPVSAKIGREQRLAELTRRYFTSHGPALAKDYAWWSGLTVADAKAGIELAGPDLVGETVDREVYWSAPSRKRPTPHEPTIVHLLPNYDEYLVAYREHRWSFDPATLRRLGRRENVLANHIIVMNGRVVGGWRRTFANRAVTVEARLLVPLDGGEGRALEGAVERYGRFLGMPATLRRRRP